MHLGRLKLHVQWFRRICIYTKIHYTLTYAPTKFEVAKLNSLGLDLGVKITQNAALHPLHRVTYALAKFEVVTSYCLGDVFTRKYII